MTTHFARSALRRLSRRAPTLYNWRNQHNVLVQRLRGGIHDPDYLALRNTNLEAPLIIDVGANTGQSIQSFKAIFPNCEITSIEPSPFVLAALLRTAVRFGGVRVASLAAAEEFGTMSLHTPALDGVQFTQYASLLRPDTQTLAQLFETDGFGRTEDSAVSILESICATAPLDSFVQECDILKIDTEGYEHQVVLGALNLINHAKPIIMVERPSLELRQLLMGLEYLPIEGTSETNEIFYNIKDAKGLAGLTDNP